MVGCLEMLGPHGRLRRRGVLTGTRLLTMSPVLVGPGVLAGADGLLLALVLLGTGRLLRAAVLVG
ncbi:hypothetical protein DFJ69_2593 [Thermomonospora umbrina]|uniref:Uncharacterized protein n=1 Tax=Thermomonospora umbrina TaxID=111806 RepID=A0A3D9SMH7_9ACTN|nr:hypothetical protein DFJ69_2593 [Thermomonospora umbrina]